MQQVYKRTIMLKCDFNKVALNLYWTRNSAWVFSCNFAAYFQSTFSSEHLWHVASVEGFVSLEKLLKAWSQGICKNAWWGNNKYKTWSSKSSINHLKVQFFHFFKMKKKKSVFAVLHVISIKLFTRIILKIAKI